jgi:hypothetical protein
VENRVNPNSRLLALSDKSFIYLVKILEFELILNSSWVHGNYIRIKYL